MKIIHFTTPIFILLIYLTFKVNCQNCGRQKVNIESRIINGYQSKPGDWPWHVAIYHLNINNKDISYKCGGTIISKDAVLTAAHCVFENKKKLVNTRLRVHAGRSKLLIVEPYIQDNSVLEIIIHENYDVFSLKNDIAILKLGTEFNLTSQYVEQICLWKTNRSIIGDRGTVVGWGLTEKSQAAEVLNQATMIVQSNEHCVSVEPGYKEILTDMHYCAGDQNGTTICSGDSGGGMFFKFNNEWTIKGIVSAGGYKLVPNKQSCDLNVHVVFTDVSKYIDWISSKLSLTISEEPKLDKQFLVNNNDCGSSHNSSSPTSSKIYSNFPWMARVMFYRIKNKTKYVESYSSAGALISERYVATIAYYVIRDLIKHKPFVKLGDYNTENKENCTNGVHSCVYSQKIDVQSIFYHSGYDEKTKSHDVALLRLKQVANLNDIERVNTICLPIDESLRNTEPSQYVQTNWWEFNKDRKSVVANLPVKFTAKVDCKFNHSMTKYAAFTNKFCTTKDECAEMVGGSVVQVVQQYKFKQRHFLYGFLVATWDECNISDMAVDMTKYVDWILEKIDT